MHSDDALQGHLFARALFLYWSGFARRLVTEPRLAATRGAAQDDQHQTNFIQINEIFFLTWQSNSGRHCVTIGQKSIAD